VAAAGETTGPSRMEQSVDVAGGPSQLVHCASFDGPHLVLLDYRLDEHPGGVADRLALRDRGRHLIPHGARVVARGLPHEVDLLLRSTDLILGSLRLAFELAHLFSRNDREDTVARNAPTPPMAVSQSGNDAAGASIRRDRVARAGRKVERLSRMEMMGTRDKGAEKPRSRTTLNSSPAATSGLMLLGTSCQEHFSGSSATGSSRAEPARTRRGATAPTAGSRQPRSSSALPPC
jgi:hypothetical protein